MGQIGLAVSCFRPDWTRPEVAYALIEHEDHGLWWSEDKGESWQRVAEATTSRRINTRPF